MNKDDELESLFEDKTLPNEENIQSVLKTVQADIGQRDTLMFAFVKIWVTMAELFAPLFASLFVNNTIKNSQSLNPKQQTLATDTKHQD